VSRVSEEYSRRLELFQSLEAEYEGICKTIKEKSPIQALREGDVARAKRLSGQIVELKKLKESLLKRLEAARDSVEKAKERLENGE
jgi:hypothetical protein